MPSLTPPPPVTAPQRPGAPAAYAPTLSYARPEPPAQATTTGGFAVTSLVIGLLSFFMGWSLIAPLIGLTFGIVSRRREPGSRTLSTWGIVLNSIFLGIWALGALVIGVVWFGFMAVVL